MNISPGNIQAIGARKEQQDAFGFSDLADGAFVDHGGVLAVVADGMGGLSFGAESSRLAVDAMLREYMAKSHQESVLQALVRALKAANGAVHKMSLEKRAEYDTGSTLVAAVVKEQKLYWISVGDSRLYLLRNGNLTCLTRDHVYANDLAREVQKGIITKEAAATHPERMALTSYLGVPELPEIDRNLQPFALQAGDRIMLCSDGLYGALSEMEMAAGLKRQDPQQAAEALARKVTEKNRPSQDNLTAAILAIEPDGPAEIVKKPKKMIGRWCFPALLILLAIALAATWHWKNHSAKPEPETAPAISQSEQPKLHVPEVPPPPFKTKSAPAEEIILPVVPNSPILEIMDNLFTPPAPPASDEVKK